VTDSQQLGGAVPGWYADPTGQAGVRWWDGAQWTAYTAPTPAVGAGGIAPPPRPQLPATTPVYTPFVWLIVLLPLLSLVASVVARPHYRYEYVGGIHTIDPASVYTPTYVLTLLLGFVLYGLMVVFAYLDHRALRRVGVVRPFHWAWTFLWSGVYIIGRGVIVRQVARPRGLAPVWVLIGVTVVTIVVAIVISVATASQTFSQLRGY
jgi:heme exporter protein D